MSYRKHRVLLLLFSGAAFVLAGISPARAGLIDFTSTITAYDPNGNIICCNGDPSYIAYLSLLSDGTATGTATGFAELAGSITFQWGDFSDSSSGWGFEDWVWIPGESYFRLYDSTDTLIATASDLRLDLDINTANGSTTGSGTVMLSGPSGSPFYQETLAGSGGVLNLQVTSFSAFGYNYTQPYTVVGYFDTSGVPEPGSLALAGLAGWGMMLYARRRALR
jgi:hypothetical protein